MSAHNGSASDPSSLTLGSTSSGDAPTADSRGRSKATDTGWSGCRSGASSSGDDVFNLKPKYVRSPSLLTASGNSSYSTVWGPGARTGKALKALGESAQALAMRISISRWMASKKLIINDRARLRAVPVADRLNICMELAELTQDYYSKAIRTSAAKLISGITLNSSAAPSVEADESLIMLEALVDFGLFRAVFMHDIYALHLRNAIVTTLAPQLLNPDACLIIIRFLDAWVRFVADSVLRVAASADEQPAAFLQPPYKHINDRLSEPGFSVSFVQAMVNARLTSLINTLLQEYDLRAVRRACDLIVFVQRLGSGTTPSSWMTARNREALCGLCRHADEDVALTAATCLAHCIVHSGADETYDDQLMVLEALLYATELIVRQQGTAPAQLWVACLRLVGDKKCQPGLNSIEPTISKLFISVRDHVRRSSDAAFSSSLVLLTFFSRLTECNPEGTINPTVLSESNDALLLVSSNLQSSIGVYGSSSIALRTVCAGCRALLNVSRQPTSGLMSNSQVVVTVLQEVTSTVSDDPKFAEARQMAEEAIRNFNASSSSSLPGTFPAISLLSLSTARPASPQHRFVEAHEVDMWDESFTLFTANKVTTQQMISNKPATPVKPAKSKSKPVASRNIAAPDPVIVHPRKKESKWTSSAKTVLSGLALVVFFPLYLPFYLVRKKRRPSTSSASMMDMHLGLESGFSGAGADTFAYGPQQPQPAVHPTDIYPPSATFSAYALHPSLNYTPNFAADAVQQPYAPSRRASAMYSPYITNMAGPPTQDSSRTSSYMSFPQQNQQSGGSSSFASLPFNNSSNRRQSGMDTLPGYGGHASVETLPSIYIPPRQPQAYQSPPGEVPNAPPSYTVQEWASAQSRPANARRARPGVTFNVPDDSGQRQPRGPQNHPLLPVTEADD